MEPEVVNLYNNGAVLKEESIEGCQSIATVSIAISLKRIADAITGVPYDNTPGADNSRHCMGLTEGIMLAIEQALLAASQRG